MHGTSVRVELRGRTYAPPTHSLSLSLSSFPHRSAPVRGKPYVRYVKYVCANFNLGVCVGEQYVVVSTVLHYRLRHEWNSAYSAGNQHLVQGPTVVSLVVVGVGPCHCALVPRVRRRARGVVVRGPWSCVVVVPRARPCGHKKIIMIKLPRAASTHRHETRKIVPHIQSHMLLLLLDFFSLLETPLVTLTGLPSLASLSRSRAARAAGSVPLRMLLCYGWRGWRGERGRAAEALRVAELLLVIRVVRTRRHRVAAPWSHLHLVRVERGSRARRA